MFAVLGDECGVLLPIKQLSRVLNDVLVFGDIFTGEDAPAMDAGPSDPQLVPTVIGIDFWFHSVVPQL